MKSKKINYPDANNPTKDEYIELYFDLEISSALNKKKLNRPITHKAYIKFLRITKRNLTRLEFADPPQIIELIKKLERKNAGRPVETKTQLNCKKLGLQKYLEKHPGIQFGSFNFDSYDKWCDRNGVSEKCKFSKSYLKKNITTLIELLSPIK